MSIRIPSRDVVNGIVRGYNVSYTKADKAGAATGPEESITFHRTLSTDLTVANITGLEEFTWYKVSVKAFTSIGLSANKSEPVLIRTSEDGMFSSFHLRTVR